MAVYISQKDKDVEVRNLKDCLDGMLKEVTFCSDLHLFSEAYGNVIKDIYANMDIRNNDCSKDFMFFTCFFTFVSEIKKYVTCDLENTYIYKNVSKDYELFKKSEARRKQELQEYNDRVDFLNSLFK